MSPFWASFAEHLKGCGRNATIFLMALAGLAGLLVIGGIGAAVMKTDEFKTVFPIALAAAVLSVAVKAVRLVRQSRIRRRQLQQRPLSDDELRVARLKLLKDRHSNGA